MSTPFSPPPTLALPAHEAGAICDAISDELRARAEAIRAGLFSASALSDETKAAAENISAAFAAWPSELGAICDRIAGARRAEAYDDTVERMAREIEAILARQDSVDSDDLATLGWTVTQIAEIAPDALERVRARAVHHLS